MANLAGTATLTWDSGGTYVADDYVVDGYFAEPTLQGTAVAVSTTTVTWSESAQIFGTASIAGAVSLDWSAGIRIPLTDVGLLASGVSRGIQESGTQLGVLKSGTTRGIA